MASMKAQIIQVVEQMDDDTIFSVWDMITRHFDTPLKKITWDDIEEVEPDEIDLAMMAEMENDPDCTVYITQDELLAKRKLEEKMKEAV